LWGRKYQKVWVRNILREGGRNIDQKMGKGEYAKVRAKNIVRGGARELSPKEYHV